MDKLKLEREGEIPLKLDSVPVERGLLRVRTELLKPENKRAEMHIIFGCYANTIELNREDYARQYDELQERIRAGKYKILLRQNGQLGIEIL